MLSNPWFNNNSLLNSPTSFKISGEKVTKSDLSQAQTLILVL